MSFVIKRSIIAEMIVTPEELAAVFCEMDGLEQARFFNEVGVLSDKWEAPFCFQLQRITDAPNLTTGGRTIMSAIGDYSEWQKYK